MAIALPGVDRLPAGPRRTFVEALHELYDGAGHPSVRTISRQIYKRPRAEIETVSHETVNSTLRGSVVPAWPKVQAMVTVLALMSIREVDLDERMTRLHELWLEARRPAPEPPPPPPPAPVRAPAPAALRPQAPPEPPAVEGDLIVGALPERNAGFVGREIMLDTMRENLLANPNAPLVLHGLGGVGKTQLAQEYAHRYAGAYDVVWWVPAEPAEQARQALAGLAEHLGVPPRGSAEQTIGGVLRELESQRVKFLLVFDGAEGEGVRRLIPAIGGDVVVTSRDPEWAHDSTNARLEVPDFDAAEAIQFLRRRDDQMTGAQATEVADRVGRLPLALEQLVSLRLETGWGWSDLLPRLDDPDGRLLATAARPAHYPFTVARSLQLTMDRLRAVDPAAMPIFELFAWFGAEPVPVSLLRRGADADVPPELRETLVNPIALNRAVAGIYRFGLGRLHTQDQRVEVPPMVRLALRDALSAEASRRARRSVHEILIAADPGSPDDADPGSPDDADREQHRAIAPHVLPSELVQSRLPAAQRAVYHQVRYRYLLGDYEDARRVGETAVLAWRDPAFLGPDAEIVLLTMREWANALRALGSYGRSLEVNAEAITRLRASERYGDDHPYTLDAARGYAADLRISGEYQDALDLDQDTYERHARRYAESDVRTAVSHHNLAVSCRLLGRFADAEAIDRDELERRRTSRGDDDGRTRLSLNALAEDLYGLGRFAEVLELGVPPLSTLGATVRPEELGLLLAVRTMGLAHRRLGRHSRALKLLQAHYTECLAAYGAEHGFTLAAMMSCANTLRESSITHGLALSFVSGALGGYQKAFGSGNPLTLAAQVNLAVIQRAGGDRQQALRTGQAAWLRLRGTVGDRHPFTISAWINLATDRWSTGDFDGARADSKRAYALAREVRGPWHHDTLVAAANLLIDDASAGPSQAEVLGAMRRTIGPDHPLVTAVTSGERVDCDIEPPSL